MRILSISGQNIASLADPFHIDLSAEPLRSSGLFAITGETGAGKSSILDAMCLALYGDAPRLAAGSTQDEVPDAGGETIKAKDPRAILRRGAAQASAAVRFEALDGEAYEARWQTRRARDRAEGKLQAVSRSIARLSDGQVLASQSTVVAEKVQALTGLSYDEFRRTVLLAQGDFDAFLRAESNDRAALLEKVTGTGLYRDISVRVYDRAQAAEAALKDLQTRHAAHQLLSAEDRAALEEERQALTSAVADRRTARLAVEADLMRHQRHEAARLQRDGALQAHQTAMAAHAAADEERARMTLITRAEPLRVPFQALRQAQSGEVRAHAALAAAQAALTDATVLAEGRQAAATAAAEALAAEEARYKSFGPLWSEATRLDALLAEAVTEAARAEAAARAAAETSRAAGDEARALRQRHDAAQAASVTAGARLDALSALAPLSRDWPQVARDLTDHDAAQMTRDAELAKAADLARTAEAADAEAAALRAAEAANRDRRLALDADIAQLGQSIAELDAPGAQARLTELSALGEALSRLDRARQDHASAETAIAAAAQLEGEARAEDLSAHAAAEAAGLSLRDAEIRVQSLTAPVEQADLALSVQARALRLHLHPGEPCPVCGSPDHPHRDDALQALAADLRNRLSAAHADADAARRALTGAQGRRAAATARREQAAEALQRHATQRDAALAAWGAALADARSLLRCPALPDAPEPIDAAKAATDRLRGETLATLTRLDALRSRKDVAEAQRLDLTQTLDRQTAALQALSHRQADNREALALARQAAETAGARLAALALTLSPYLAAAGLGPASLKDCTAGPTLSKAAASHAEAARQVADLQQTLADLAPGLATAEADATHRAAEAEKARAEATLRDTSRSAIATARAALLDGEPTDAHRSRHNEARLAAQSAKTEADAAVSAALAALGQAKGLQEGAAEALREATQARQTAELTLAASLAAADLTADVEPLLNLPRSEVDALRQHLRALDDAMTAAASTLAAREADIAAAIADGLPDTPHDSLAAELAALDAAQTAALEAIGALTTRLQTDEATRRALAGLEAEIAAAKATSDVWKAVSDAIGSRNGDAFARIAQQVTLDVLVDHANHHLADLKPRYRLRRAAGLALQVEDLDMGAEPRATRSLSGGERFLVSLALALALSRMGDKGALAATLFIDEGFGSLDAESLDMALDALDRLQAQGRTIGVISHVEAMKERIPVQVRVIRQGAGTSVVKVTGPV